jgi:hypothetical protein
LEQMPGTAGCGSVGRKPVEHDVEAKTQAFLPTSLGHRMDRFLRGPDKAKVRAGLAEITDQQGRSTLRQERIEADIVGSKPCSLIELLVPAGQKTS